jgi:hypothetical protein
MRFEKSIHLIPRGNTEKAARLGNRKLAGANGFESEPLQGGTRQFAWVSRDPPSQILRYFQTHVHANLQLLLLIAQDVSRFIAKARDGTDCDSLHSYGDTRFD